MSALCIGSMAPDTAFFVGLDLAREQTHGLAALLMFCFPAGVLAYWLYHFLLKAPLLALLPDAVASKFGNGAMVREPWSAVLVSLLCSALTHLLWDAFTHPGTVVVNALPVLQAELGNVGGYRVYGFKVVQHASSMLGLVLLGIWSSSWLRRSPAIPVARRHPISRARRIGVVAVLMGGPVLAGIYAGLQRRPLIANLADVQAFAAGFVFTALPTAALLLVGFSALWHVRARAQR